jgi:membrane associated rhomboid family serine protease
MTERRERAINAPWPVLALVAILIGAFAVQSLLGVDAVNDALAFSPQDLFTERYGPLVIAIFLHGGWPHVLMNAAFALVFATPVARQMGEDAKGAAAFFVFFLACGILANAGYALLSLGNGNPAVGASGAVAGMMGAASRLLGRPGDLAPFRSRNVVVMAASWIVINLFFGLVLVGWMPGSEGAPLAWQVHLAGYAAGLFLIGPALALIGRLGSGPGPNPDHGQNPDHGIEN